MTKKKSEQTDINTMDAKESKKWYDEAGKQTFETLPEFIAKVRAEFTGYESLNKLLKDHKLEKYSKEYFEVLESPECKRVYQNGMIVGVLISYAAFHATAKAYGYSCNQAGVVRNAFYHAIMDDKTLLGAL